MSEFIKNNPVFSYIAVPVLFVAFVILIVVVLSPRAVKWDYFSRLYQSVLDTTGFIDRRQAFNQDKLKTLIKKLAKMKFYYEMLESEELYELEEIIKNIEKALGIARALSVARATAGEITDYLTDIENELKAVEKVMHVFSLTRVDENTGDFSGIRGFKSKRSKKKAAEYLKSIKKD